MKNNFKAFSLIEVIVATSILTIAVFGVFKLIGENSKIISQSQNYIQSNFLLQPSKECLDYLLKDNDLDYMKNNLSGSYLDLNNFSGVCSVGINTTVNTVDNIDYQIYIEKNNEGTDFVDWKINVLTDTTSSVTIDYLQK